ncbi:transcription factor bHLH35-like [Magnolia sinica]|uniref:transcription factor bHLH35-like n=1 Tax=Magnolia sinica TaxID=86752 RepID=UPI002659CBE9|nr:transcription factor bHLH35-like [Magnolia sinica]
MEDLECFLVEEGPDIWPGCPELENSFSSSLDAWWNGHMSDLDGNDLNLSSLLEEGDSAHTSIPRLSVLHTKMKNNNNNNNNENKKQNNNSNNNNKNKKQNNNKKLMGSLNQMDLIRNSSLLDEDESTLQPSSSIGSINQIEQLQQQSNDDEEAEEEESDSDDKKANAPNSKNLVSERNRRKRLNQQLFSLRSLIPNITKMDKRSILVDALAYLQSILQQIEREKENTNITEDSSCDDDSLDVQEEIPPMQPQELIPCDSLAISQVLV